MDDFGASPQPDDLPVRRNRNAGTAWSDQLVGFTALMATLVLSVIICNAVIPRYLSDPTTLARSKLVAALTVAALGALMLYTLLQEVGRALLRRSARRRA